MTAVDWSRWRQCEVCAAQIGQPCLTLSGHTAADGPVTVAADRPHGGRKQRTSKATTPERT